MVSLWRHWWKVAQSFQWSGCVENVSSFCALHGGKTWWNSQSDSCFLESPQEEAWLVWWGVECHQRISTNAVGYSNDGFKGKSLRVKFHWWACSLGGMQNFGGEFTKKLTVQGLFGSWNVTLHYRFRCRGIQKMGVTLMDMLYWFIWFVVWMSEDLIQLNYELPK